jgi:ubiquinone/menaquinone biosynthesis C-methylase UbiE
MRDLTAETKVREFYDTKGWDKNSSGESIDAELWEDLRECAHDYIVACRKKILKYLPKVGGLFLDAASGPIQYAEYLEYSAFFSKHICVDISQKALEQAKAKLGDRGEYYCVSILELPFQNNTFDAIVSLHTIYHIDKDQQEAAVRQLIRVAKPNCPLVIIYSNPDMILNKLFMFFRPVKRLAHFIKRLVKKTKHKTLHDKQLYFFAHPISWWKRFEDTCYVDLEIWRSLAVHHSKRIAPNNIVGKAILNMVLRFENRFPKLAVRLGQYPMIILKKRN